MLCTLQCSLEVQGKMSKELGSHFNCYHVSHKHAFPELCSSTSENHLHTSDNPHTLRPNYFNHMFLLCFRSGGEFRRGVQG